MSKHDEPAILYMAPGVDYGDVDAKLAARRAAREAKPVIIGFAGYAGSGKTTAALYLGAKYDFVRFRFGDGLKKMLHAIGVSWEHLDGGKKEEPLDLLSGKTARYAMQTLGTEWGRHLIDPNLWINVWARAIADHKRVAVDDVRFPNEVDIIHRLGGIVVLIERPGVVRKHAHVSEELPVSLISADAYIPNDLDITDDLYAELDHLLQKIIGEVS